MLYRKNIHKTIAIFTLLTMLISSFFNHPVLANDDTENEQSPSDEYFLGIGRDDMYSQYIEKHKDKSRPDTEIIIQAEDFTHVEGMEVEVLDEFLGATGKVIKTEESGTIEWEVDIAEAGLYNIAIRYYPVEGKSSDIERELYINDEIPFQEAATLTFPRTWDNELDEIQSDNRGNHLRPRQVEKPIWMEMDFQDSEGYYTEPFLFYFEEGINKISFVSAREPMVIDYIKLYQVEEIPTYKEVAASYDNLDVDIEGKFIKIQGEDAVLKSSPTLYPINDRSSPATEPYHVSKIRMNSIGGYNWRWPGQWITWEVDIPEDGLYKIGIKFKQNMLRGVYSTRKLYIDGKVPFKEMEKIPFYYNNKWDMHVLGGEEEPYFFYLTKGKHEITLEVTLGDLAPLIRTVENSVLELNRAYRQIIMVTGASPDPYRDYELEKKIPGLLDTFKEQSEILSRVLNRLVEVTGEKSDKTAILNTMVVQLEDFIDRPETIQRRLDTFKTNVGALGTWILTVREQPLEIDYIVVASPEQKMPEPDVGFIKKATHEVRSFFYSFIEDYNTIGNVAEDEDDVEITVWIGTGRDQAQVMKQMIDDTFTPLTGIYVKLQLVDMNSLLPATLAGQGPDVAMQIQNNIPVNYAMRNAVVDLTEFPDFDEVANRFRESALLPYRYDGGVYALPEQQIFSMMFYRKDIFEELELKVPETWEEFYEIIPELQKNHMEVALPLAQDPQNPGDVQNLIPNQTFVMMLYQNDGELYAEYGKKSALDSPVSMEIFKDWTSLYTNYKLPLKFDFLNRFRTGEMPIGIADYTFYNTLAVAAPEIRGLWEFVPVPGTIQEDGTIRREVSSTGTAVVIMEQAKNKEASWEFLKWWTSKETQVRFGREMESLMGAAARYPTANIEALEELPWPVKDYQRIEEQWQWVRGVPEVPGGYFTGRHLDNAFREVINNGTNPREALTDYVVYINDEIRAKRKEFNLPLE